MKNLKTVFSLFGLWLIVFIMAIFIAIIFKGHHFILRSFLLWPFVVSAIYLSKKFIKNEN